ncbi:unnamed protein product [Brachionus calyciflorus]|uniref:Uncharacterized protein n=1 Tax=Brachionus calyciflorus TaxID=104777 RepID=A0A813Q3R9_9BILA|nr:unnamed protein product [Brachionus calyciflorus]
MDELPKDLKIKNINPLKGDNNNNYESKAPSLKKTDSYSSIFKTKSLNKKSRKKLQTPSLTSINSYTQTPLSFYKNDDTQSIILETIESPAPLIKIDYDTLIPNKCGDLTKINFNNNLEKYLITRIYSNVNKLSSILSEMDNIDLEYFLNTPDQNECLPLYYAIKAQCLNTIKLLLMKGSSLNKTTKSGDPAIHLACLLGADLELVEFFLNQNEDLYKIDQEGWCALHCACNQGHLEIVRYLIEKKFMNPNVKDAKTSYTGIQLAAINGRIEIVDYLLSFQSLASVKKKTHLEDDDDIKKKAKKNEKINLEPKFLYSVDQKLNFQPKFMFNNFLIDLKSQNNEGHTLLHLACLYGHYDIVNLILKKYASNQIDVNLVDFKGRTCLDLAWYWLINTSDEKSLFYDSENSFYVQRKGLICDERIEKEIKLIFLLVNYGAKFSDIKIIMYELEQLSYQSKNITSIQIYLKCLLHLSKLNLPTLFLNLNKINSCNVSDVSSLSCNISELEENLSCLETFIRDNVIDDFEREFYFNDLKSVKLILDKF